MRTAEDILSEGKTIAVVGLSPRPERDSHLVAKYLKEQGYRIIPVNPMVDEVLGEKSYPDLKAIPERVDVVDVFRKAEDVLPIVDQAIDIGASAVWMQLGIVNEAAATRAREAGLGVVMDLCMLIEHKRMVGKGKL
ncbi:MAG: CoA-binding protein [Chloroflexi bacterium]|nr:CoA-binding protein [Chloroflexota bacterium]